MQKVSEEYKASMKSSLRERSYMMISFGIMNQDAQTHATISEGDFAYYSNNDSLFGKRKDTNIYATLEQDFSKVDGSMFFLPKEGATFYYDTGLVSKKTITAEGYSVLIQFNILATDIKGLTIDFGEIYPVKFDIETSNGERVQIRNNNQSIFTTQEVFNDTTYLKLIVYEMKNPHTRLRIYSIQFGYGLIYQNNEIMDSSLETYVSPICENIPQVDFYVKLRNDDQYFNVDNPDSAINFLESGQEMEVWYGYQLPDSDTIEWLRGSKLYCCDWESNDSTATIRCQDIFRNMDEEYYKGIYHSEGISYYDLAVQVFQEAKIDEYYIDPYLKKIFTKNAIPRVAYKEALQIIANACRCVLSHSRYGVPEIKSSFVPDYTLSCNGEVAYSHLENIRKKDEKCEYATLSYNYTIVDEGMFYLPKDLSEATLYTGYVSLQQSDSEGAFSENPIITIVQEAVCKYYGLRIDFGSALPADIIFRTFNSGEIIEEYEVNSDISKTLVVHHEFSDFDVMEIEFVKTTDPYNRIVVNYFSFGDTTDFIMQKQDMMESPKAIKQELVKKVIVPFYSYNKDTPKETLMNGEIEAVSGQQTTLYISDPAYDYEILLDGNESTATIISHGDYYITIEFNVSGTYQLEVTGRKYSIVEQYVVKDLNNKGKTVTWKNPLVCDKDTAEKLADWLSEYYSASVEYEYATRGNPEIDANDIVYQENDYLADMKVNIYRSTVNFSQGLSGSVITRRTPSETIQKQKFRMPRRVPFRFGTSGDLKI